MASPQFSARILFLDKPGGVEPPRVCVRLRA